MVCVLSVHLRLPLHACNQTDVCIDRLQALFLAWAALCSQDGLKSRALVRLAFWPVALICKMTIDIEPAANKKTPGVTKPQKQNPRKNLFSIIEWSRRQLPNQIWGIVLPLSAENELDEKEGSLIASFGIGSLKSIPNSLRRVLKINPPIAPEVTINRMAKVELLIALQESSCK